MLKRPRIFFDTNVLEPLSKPPLQFGLDKIRRRLSEKYVYVVSPLTVDELLLGLKGGDQKYFQRDQAKMNVLRGVGQVRMLPPPATFALVQALGLEVNPPTPSGDVVKKCIETVLKAKSKAQLEQGLVPLGVGRKTVGLNFDPIEQRHEFGKTEHARILEQLRAKQLRSPTPEEWVKKSVPPLRPST